MKPSKLLTNYDKTTRFAEAQRKNFVYSKEDADFQLNFILVMPALLEKKKSAIFCVVTDGKRKFVQHQFFCHLQWLFWWAIVCVRFFQTNYLLSHGLSNTVFFSSIFWWRICFGKLRPRPSPQIYCPSLIVECSSKMTIGLFVFRRRRV